MKTNRITLLLAAGALFLASCGTSLTVSKKQHSSGYYVSLSRNESKAQKSNDVSVEKTNNSAEVAAKKAEVKNSIAPSNTLSTKEVNKAAKTEKSENKVSTNNASKSQSTAKNSAISSLKNAAVKAKAALKVKPKKSLAGELSDYFLLVLICTILIPPLGIYLYKQQLRPVLIDILLAILGFVVGAVLAISMLGIGLGYVFALIYGLLYIFNMI